MLRPAAAVLLAGITMAISPARADPLDTDRLMADITRYETFGVHRYGLASADATLDWIASELVSAGLKVSEQRFRMDRQYVLEVGTLRMGEKTIDVVPQWWPPEETTSFDLTAPIGPTGLARLSLPYDRGAYLNDSHRAKLAQVFAQKPRAVLLDIAHPSGEIFTYNVDQSSKPWPVPVLLVAPRDTATLKPGAEATVSVRAAYRRDVEGRNVIARLDRGRGRWLVISTPVTSWFTSTCERGPGIAGFLAMARLARQRFAQHDLLFVATSGHEIGHGGMEVFMKDGAPPPRSTAAWAHFGSSLACRDPVVRAINSSASLTGLVDRGFAGIEGLRLIGEKAAVGELREVHAAGYENFFGMAGSHRLFHTASDSVAAVDPALLTPMAKAFANTLDTVR
ncbi:MAG: hypothetical protein JSS04_07380 [Proteobacteria bacterium]|nr:hypothetical protein [Pseudomonadota bacterium]